MKENTKTEDKEEEEHKKGRWRVKSWRSSWVANVTRGEI